MSAIGSQGPVLTIPASRRELSAAEVQAWGRGETSKKPESSASSPATETAVDSTK